MADSSNSNFSNLSFFKTIYNNMQTDETGTSVKVYSTELEEYDAFINGAALFDVTGSSFLEMRGTECLDYLHRISTNSIKDLKPGEFTNTIFTNEKGRMIDRVTVLNAGEHVLLMGSPVYRHKLYSWINKYIIIEDIKVTDVTSKYSAFEITGSQSRTFLSMIFGDSIEKLLPGLITSAEIEGVGFTIILNNENNIKKYIIIGRAEDTNLLLNYMFEHKSVFDFRAAGQSAYDIFRIKMGIPIAPNEINDNFNPHEANLLSDVSFTKGCYIGQEVIARLDTYNKVQRKLSFIVFNELVEKPGQTTLFDEDDREAGIITSTAHSLKNDKTIALAYVRRELSEEGTKMTAVDTNQMRFPVTVCSFGQRQ